MANFYDGSSFNQVRKPSGSKPRGVTLNGIPSNTMGDKAVIKYSNGVDGILARLFNIVCLDVSNGHGISPVVWNRYTSDYIKLTASQAEAIDRMSIRGNLNKAFRKSTMTWDVFCKGLIFLKYRAIRVTVVYKASDDKINEVSDFIHYLCQEDLNRILPLEKRDLYPGALSRAKLDLAISQHRGKKPYTFGADLVLANLLNSMIAQIIPGDGALSHQWRKLVQERVDKVSSDLSKKKKTHKRGNATKSVRKPKISWKVFCEGLQILKIKEFSVMINGVRLDGDEVESIIQTTFAIDNPTEGEDFEDNENV